MLAFSIVVYSHWPVAAALDNTCLQAASQALVRMRLWSDIPRDKFASGMELELPLPSYVTRVHCDVDPPGNASLQGWEFNEKSRLLRLRFKKVAGEVFQPTGVHIHSSG